MLLVVQLFQTRNHPFGFIKFVIGKIPHDLLAHALISPQVFRFATCIVRNNCVRGIQNGLRASVILRKHHSGYFRESIFKFQDVAEVRATEAIHALVGVAHDTHIVMQCTKHDHDGVLRHVGVLIFVNENVLKALLIHTQHVGVLTEQAHHIGEQIIEVHCPSTL